MIRILIALISISLLSISLFADSSIATFENDPSAIVEGKVNVITGEPMVFQEDLVVQGAEPIRITRAYIPGPEEEWFWGVFGSLYKLDSGYLEVTEKNGAPILYKRVCSEHVHGVKYTRYKPSNLEYGFSNTSQGRISSRTNLKNNYLLLNKKTEEFEIHCADGTVRLYQPDPKGHHLHSERLPNGNWILYEYDSFTNLKLIHSTNPAKTKTYATADVHLTKPKRENHNFSISGSDGGSVEYLYLTREESNSRSLSNIRFSSLPNQSLGFAKIKQKFRKINYYPPEEYKLRSIYLPLHREWQFDYYREGTENVAGQSIEMDDYWIGPRDPCIDPRRNRIKTLSSQVGEDARQHITHSFIYDLKNKKTSVYEIDRNRIDYLWDGAFRISKIQRYSKENKLLNAEQYVWGFYGQDLGNLRCKTFFNEKNEPVLSKRYFYDEKGNISEERLYGNLSGKGQLLVFDKDGVVTDGEFYAKRFKYSYGLLSLPIEESDDSGLCTTYDYLPDTDLLISQLTYDGSVLKMRKFWEYNEDHILLREIGDDGCSLNKDDLTGVKVRTIHQITPFTDGVYLGMPHIIEEKYWENGHECLLKKTVFIYGTGARIRQKDVYDASGEFRYSLTMDYDEKGRLSQETNALGQTRIFRYDDCDNQILAKDFSGRKTIQVDYDHSNRPTVVKTEGDDEIKFLEKISYDLKHHPISELDLRENRTKHTYDPLGRRVTTELPPIPNDLGQLTDSCTIFEHDSAGNATAQIDAEGHRTTVSYNAYGKPLVITHPDESAEKYSYNLNGSVNTYTDPRGICSQYAYDYLGRVIQKTTGNGLAVETWEYCADRLIAKTDAEGNRTTYDYDAAGRKIAEELDGEKTTWKINENRYY